MREQRIRERISAQLIRFLFGQIPQARSGWSEFPGIWHCIGLSDAIDSATNSKGR